MFILLISKILIRPSLYRKNSEEEKLGQIFEAIKILKSKGTLVNCVLVGNNIDAGDLEILTQEMGLDDQVWFYGSSYNEEKIQNCYIMLRLVFLQVMWGLLLSTH